MSQSPKFATPGLLREHMETDMKSSTARRIHDFFFAEEVPYTLALLRMALPPVLLVPVLGSRLED